MASRSHSGHIKNSSSPNVVSLNATKAPSVSTAKPRFRSRTGCWTCRRRKVKCDERGRNPETVAYGGPLQTASGCKRCEDSGRPCHGYGAQAPNRPLLNPYAAPCNTGEMANGPTSFYTFNHNTQEHPASATLPCFSNYLPTSDSTSVMSELAHWGRSSGSPKSGEHHPGPESHSPHLNPTSSSASAAPLLASASATLHPVQASLITPPLDLRRYSVPSYPTWHSLTQERHQPSQYSNTTAFRNSCYLPNVNLNAGVFFQQDGSIRDSMPASSVSIINPDNPPLSQSNLSNMSFHNARTFDPNARPNTHSANRSHLIDFGRPHTSSGVSLPHNNHNPQTHANSYRSSIFPPHEVVGGIPEVPYNPSLSPTMTNCSELGRTGWSDSICGNMVHSKVSGQSLNMIGPPHPGYHSPAISKVLSPVLHKTNAGQSPGYIKPISGTEIPNSSTPKGGYESFPSSTELQPDSNSNSTTGEPDLLQPTSRGSFQDESATMEYISSISNSQNGGHVDMQRRLSSSIECEGGSRYPLHSRTYVGSFESDMKGAVPDRKASSSSSTSSISTFENGSSPHVSLSRRLSTNQACSPSNLSSASSPGSTTQINQHHISSSNQHPIGQHSPSMNVFEVFQHTNHAPWNSLEASTVQNPRDHEFSMNANEITPENVKTELIDDESPISTANSTFSCTGKSRYNSHGSPTNTHSHRMIDELRTPFPIVYKFPAQDSSLTLVDPSQHFSTESLK
ncbi:hypothetical protein CROQUDRAFT_52839 [Cronartium quercuum f. sp. fusiforme G11]|uniref:Zn(2)-C6 fungal-type domain-containing protein n=1 Tax=Cronartium quercuum f. sp. fusiforme G11 TaxID=708437 RepID=A0A9P6T6R7_9BASI|nr:hypothetical protein CROQUDRAFT_52839 [Cronartium quercuum f. sp. fusiforme G11]